MNVEQKRREMFEAWYLLKYYEGSRQCGLDWLVREPCGGYLFDHPARHWETFNAALDAVEIELPYAVWSCDMGEKVMSADCVYAAIESTGLGLKVNP